MNTLRQSGRGFRRNPGVLSLTIFTLALGIGSTTAVFEIVDSLLIRPLPYAGSDRLFEVTTARLPSGATSPGVGVQALAAVRNEAGIFSAVEP